MSKKAINKFLRRGIKVTQVNADNEFHVLDGEIGEIMLNLAAAGEHVGDVERDIRTLKEHTRCHVHRLPYRRYPIEMICGAVIKSKYDLNRLIPYDRISKDLTPSNLIDGLPNPTYDEVMKLNFGDYTQVHHSREKTNDNEPRTTGAIALYPSGNAQGSWYFMSLDTGKKIHRYQWTVLPLSTEALERVEAIALHQEQPLVASNFKYQWDPDGEEIEVEDTGENIEEEVQIVEDEEQPPQPLAIEAADDVENALEPEHENEQVDQITDDDDEQNHEEGGVEVAGITNVEDEGADNQPQIEEEQGADDPIDDESLDVNNEVTEEVDIETATQEQAIEDACHDMNQEQAAEPTATRPRRNEDAEVRPDVSIASDGVDRSMRSGRRTHRYDYKSLGSRGTTQFSQIAKSTVNKMVRNQNSGVPAKKLKRKKKEIQVKLKDTYRRMIGVMMSQISKDGKHAQVSVKEGIKRFGDKAVQALVKELAQLHDKQTFTPLLASSLSIEEKKMALNLLAVIKQKRCGKIKGRIVADGRKQRKYVPREDATSPTIKLESLLMSLVVDAKEEREMLLRPT